MLSVESRPNRPVSNILDTFLVSGIFDTTSGGRRRGTAERNDRMSFHEKSVWVTMASMMALFGTYFWIAGGMLARGITAAVAYVPLLAVVVAGLVVLITVGHVILAIAERPDDGDERDRLISWRAEHHSAWLLGVGVIAAVFGLAADVGSAWIANGLILSLFLSELLKQSLQLVAYRRGF